MRENDTRWGKHKNRREPKILLTWTMGKFGTDFFRNIWSGCRVMRMTSWFFFSLFLETKKEEVIFILMELIACLKLKYLYIFSI